MAGLIVGLEALTSLATAAVIVRCYCCCRYQRHHEVLRNSGPGSDDEEFVLNVLAPMTMMSPNAVCCCSANQRTGICCGAYCDQ